MVDIVTEIIRATVLALIVIGLIVVGRRRQSLAQPGWNFLIIGFGLLLLACVLDVTDNFESLNRFVVIGDTETQSILEKLVGFLGGFIMIAIGLLYWLPSLTSMDELKSTAAELEHVNTQLEVTATTDKLTGLPNRTMFYDRLDQIMKRARRDKNLRFAVFFFDFDRFKVVNDSLGHDVGDALLCSIAKILRAESREMDTVARLGGDEFVLLLGGINQWSEAELIAERLLTALAVPHKLGDQMVVSTASIGIVTNERAYETPSEMIRDADAAMYQAKENGKAQVVVFDQQMHQSALDRLSLETDMRTAILKGNQFRLHYQPIVALDTGKPKGFEALFRWEHPVHGIISPVSFIPIAEDTGLIIEMGRWAMNTAAKQLADWKQRFNLDDNTLSMNVNIAKRQLLAPTFLQEAIDCRKEFRLHPKELHLEITESTIADDRSNIGDLLRKLREQGFPIAMDDFGTGMSSLSSLHDFPIDVLKIDQAFIRVLDRDRSLLAIVMSITNLAENLGIETVAEGIETEDVVGALQTINCTWAQGYYFAKPMTSTDAEAYICKQLNIKTPKAA